MSITGPALSDNLDTRYRSFASKGGHRDNARRPARGHMRGNGGNYDHEGHRNQE